MQNKLSAHIGYLFNEVPLEDRIAAAAAAGFTAVEHPQPFGVDPHLMRKMLNDQGLVFTQLAGGAGEASRGEKGLASLPGREADFRTSFDTALEYAQIVGAPLIHPMAGVPDANDIDRAQNAYLENMRYAVERASDAGITVLIEAISNAAVPGYAVSTLSKAIEIQDIFDLKKVTILVDTFHAAVTEVDLTTWIPLNGDRIGHVHIADFPGRHEPGTGTLPFNDILSALQSVSFKGAIGFEYVPLTSTIESTAFLESWKRRS